MATVRIGEQVSRPYVAFADRREAGERLAAFMGLRPDAEALVLGLPRGGITAGEPIARALGAPLHPVLARKLPVPISPEMGFGAVALDGTMVLNERVVRELGIREAQINSIAERVREEVRRRARAYRGDQVIPNVRKRRVYMVDDGLATGYSMIAAAKMVRKQSPDFMILAVPVSPLGSIGAVEPYFDAIHCLIAQDYSAFAVASYYRDFHDMSDEEVIGILRRQEGSQRNP